MPAREIVDYILNAGEFLLEDLGFHRTAGNRLDGRVDCLALLADQALHFIELEDNLGQILRKFLHHLRALIPVSFEPIIDGTHDRLLLLGQKLQNLLVNLGCNLKIGINRFLKRDHKGIVFDQILARIDNTIGSGLDGLESFDLLNNFDVAILKINSHLLFIFLNQLKQVFLIQLDGPDQRSRVSLPFALELFCVHLAEESVDFLFDLFALGMFSPVVQ